MAFKFRPVDPEEEERRIAAEDEAESINLARSLGILPEEPHINLGRFRRRRGFKKTEMAEMMDVTPRSYYAYESGKRPIPTEALVRLNMHTGADLNEILTGRPSSQMHDRIVSETISVLRVLMATYEGLPLHRAEKIIRETIRYAHGENQIIDKRLIDEMVAVEMRHKYHPENIPAPPFHEAYGEDQQEQFKRDEAEWHKSVEEGLEGRKWPR